MNRLFARSFAPLACALACGPLSAQVTQRVSISTAGVEGNDGSEMRLAITPDGRYVVFESPASNLVAGDTNGVPDIFLRDRLTGVTERVSVGAGGAEADFDSGWPSISSDGRYVAFFSYATNLIALDSNVSGDIFVRDRQNGTTERVSVDSIGIQSNGTSRSPSISSDGRYVAFQSDASNLVIWDPNFRTDVFRHDRQTGTTELVSIDPAGNTANHNSNTPAISADGRYVAFDSAASNLVVGDTNGTTDVFIRDCQFSTTVRVSVDSSALQVPQGGLQASISANGQYVGFMSSASALVAGDTNGSPDAFVHDWTTGTTERVSVGTGGTQASSGGLVPALSPDGRYVAFMSSSSNLVVGDTNGDSDVFIRDLLTGVTERVSVSSSGTQANDGSGTFGLSVSADGRHVAFPSSATNLVTGDTNAKADYFVRDRTGTDFTSLCDPGVGGVQTCPCGNAPSGSGRGCNNSAATGGASLAASGANYLSSDSLVFTTSGEKPTATSVLLQGPSSPAAGIIYGQGLRCVGGVTKRLFTKSAVAGSITVPNFGAGDPTVSARSAAKGDVIGPGQTRWYLVFYRDPIVLGGCPVTSTFNATQTGRVVWSP